MNNVAIFGYGTVGKGVKEIIDTLDNAKVVKIFDLPFKKDELKELYCGDLDAIINDSSIDTVIECMGGDTIAREVIIKSLTAGKNVISSNKQTISLHMREYFILANQHHASFQFEASVGGGMPLLQSILIQSEFDRVRSVHGILNGTCNYILTRMNEGMSFEKALKLAQEKGFAEHDPSDDINGTDMARKGSIIASLTTGCEVNPEDVTCFEISHITPEIIEFFKARGQKLKYVTDIIYEGHLSIIVLPIVVSKKNMLYSIDEEVNGCLMDAKYNEPITIIGKGAGRYPTAAAICQDLERVINHAVFHMPELEETVVARPNLTGKFFAFDNQNQVHELVNPSLEELRSYPFIAKETA